MMTIPGINVVEIMFGTKKILFIKTSSHLVPLNCSFCNVFSVPFHLFSIFYWQYIFIVISCFVCVYIFFKTYSTGLFWGFTFMMLVKALKIIQHNVKGLVRLMMFVSVLVEEKALTVPTIDFIQTK